MSLSRKAAEKLYQISKAESEGNWEELKYTILTPEIIRSFIEYMNRTGNSFICKQENIDILEKDLKEYKTYSSWAEANPISVIHGMGRAFMYLFT